MARKNPRRDFDALKAEMLKIAGVVPGRTTRNYFPRRNYTAGGFSKPDQSRPGTLDVQFGVTPSDYEVMQNLKRLGMVGVPKGRSKLKSSAPSAGAQTAPAAPAGPSLFEQLVKDSQAKETEANRQNQLRYDQVLQNQNDLRGRVMGEVNNWGGVQQQLNDQKAAETLSSIKADMAARGIANSNVTPAFQQRNARDLALTQQDLSERKSARQIGYDTALTQDQNAFIERRNDVGPDQSALLQLALQYGQSGNGTGTLPQAPATQQSQPQYKPQQQFQGGGVSPYRASMMANQILGGFANGAQGMMQSAYNGANAMIGGAFGMSATPGIVSNAYPGSRPYAPYVGKPGMSDEERTQRAARNARVRSNSADMARRKMGLSFPYKGRVVR